MPVLTAIRHERPWSEYLIFFKLDLYFEADSDFNSLRSPEAWKDKESPFGEEDHNDKEHR